jgi:hypothetical protein
MDLYRKLAIAGVAIVFVLGLAITEASAQGRGRYYGGRTYGGAYVVYNSGYSRYNRRYRNNYGRRRHGLSARERRILAYRRARMIRAAQRYYRTRARILNRRSYRNAYYRPYAYRNY